MDNRVTRAWSKGRDERSKGRENRIRETNRIENNRSVVILLLISVLIVIGDVGKVESGIGEREVLLGLLIENGGIVAKQGPRLARLQVPRVFLHFRLEHFRLGSFGQLFVLDQDLTTQLIRRGKARGTAGG